MNKITPYHLLWSTLDNCLNDTFFTEAIPSMKTIGRGMLYSNSVKTPVGAQLHGAPQDLIFSSGVMDRWGLQPFINLIQIC